MSVTLMVEVQGLPSGAPNTRSVTANLPMSMAEATKPEVNAGYLHALRQQVHATFGLHGKEVHLFFAPDGSSRVMPLTSILQIRVGMLVVARVV